MIYRCQWRATLTGLALLAIIGGNPISTKAATVGTRFEVSFPVAVSSHPITGRLFVLISRTNEPEVRLQDYGFNPPEFLGVDVHGWKAGEVAIVDESTLGYPFSSVKDLPPGDYYVQAAVTSYLEYHRADGHVIWALNQWEGQRFNASPGDLYSTVERIHIDGSKRSRFKMSLSNVVPAPPLAADTEWLKHVKIQSKLLTQFWGRPIYLGAVVLLPRDYASHPDTRYPVIYQQQAHFSNEAPFGFRVADAVEKTDDRILRESRGHETGYEFYQAWISDVFPQIIAVAFQHPTPYADLSAGVDSANNGPYDEAITTELIPYIEDHFNIIREPYARALVGKSAGGRDALAQKLHHPEFYGGAWIFYPWAFDYQRYFVMNVYDEQNVYQQDSVADPLWKWLWSGTQWTPLERNLARTVEGQPIVSVRQLSQHDRVMGGDRWPGGEFGADDAINGPVGSDGYPQSLWNRQTGEIDPEVAAYWRQHADLAHYVEEHWPTIGPLLVGKLHFYVGDMDEFYRNYGVHHFQRLLERLAQSDHAASFEYGALKGHGWQPMTNASLVKIIADSIDETAPKRAALLLPTQKRSK